MCEKTTFVKVKEEQNQGLATRRALYEAIEEMLKRPVISYCSSFRHEVLIDDGDAIILEDVLRTMDLKRGIALLINSPGGYGLAAERIIRILRKYSGTGEYYAIVAGKAKSAATMICLGASKILMDSTSELGPVDPQLEVKEGRTRKIYSVYNLVKSYDKLFKAAIKEKGNIEPYIQQLQNYDARDIEEYLKVLELSKDISVKALRSGMLSNMNEAKIKTKIKSFLSPVKVKSHSRAIYAEEAKACDLNIEIVNLKDKAWSNVYELYFRIDNLLNTTTTAKLIESKDVNLFVGGYYEKSTEA